METNTTTILQEKINQAIENNHNKIVTNGVRFEELTKNIEDNIIVLNGDRPIVVPTIDRTKLNFVFKDEYRREIHPNALNQMSAKFDIPSKYINDLATGDLWKNNLAAHTLTKYFANTDRQKVLLRSINGELRGFLSDRYKRLNSYEIMSNFLSGVRNNGLNVFDMHVSDTRNWIEVLDKNIINIDTPNNGIVSAVFGMRMSNSDFGDGAFELNSYFLQVICMNGMTRKNAIRQVHLGRKLDENIEYSQKTYELDTAATVSAMNDTVKYLVSPEYRMKQIATIQKASEKIIEVDSYIKKLTPMGMLKNEVESVKSLLMANRIEDGLQGEASLWKFCQSIGAVGRDKDEIRHRELDQISGKLLELVEVN